MKEYRLTLENILMIIVVLIDILYFQTVKKSISLKHGIMNKMTRGKKNNGFTLIELMIGMAIISLLSMVVVPQFNAMLPRYRLKSAARGIQANMQTARLQAIKENNPVQIRFDNTNSPGFYYFDTIDDNVFTVGEFRVDLLNYKSGIDFGAGNAPLNWNNNACSQATAITFGTRGTANPATVYLQNTNATICYAITTSITGTSKIRMYNGSLPFNINNWFD